MQGAATQTMCDIVEDPEQARDAPRRAAAPMSSKPLQFAGYDSIGNAAAAKCQVILARALSSSLWLKPFRVLLAETSHNPCDWDAFRSGSILHCIHEPGPAAGPSRKPIGRRRRRGCSDHLRGLSERGARL